MKPLKTAPKDGQQIIVWNIETRCFMIVQWDTWVAPGDDSPPQDAWVSPDGLSYGTEQLGGWWACPEKP